MTEEKIRIAVDPGEIRWTGAPGIDEEVGRAVVEAAAPFGTDVTALVRMHVGGGVRPRTNADGWHAWPRAPWGSPGASFWKALRGLADEIDALPEHPRAAAWKIAEEPGRSSVRELAAMCRGLSRTVPLALVDRGRLDGLAKASQAPNEFASTSPRGDSLFGPGTPSEGDAFLRKAGDIVASLRPFAGLAAMAALADPHAAISRAYKEVIAAHDARANAFLEAKRGEIDEALLEQTRRVDEGLHGALIARTRAQELLEEAEKAQQALKSANEAFAVHAWGTTFGESAAKHGISAEKWVRYSAGFGVLALAAAGGAFFCGKAPDDWIDVVHALGPRLLMVAIPLSAAIWSARMSTMHRRAQIADAHREKALATHELLLKSATTDEARAAVLAAVTSCVFGRTASLDHGPEPALAVFAEIARGAKGARD